MRIPQRSVLLLGVHLPVCEILENETTCTKESKVVNYTTYIPYRGHLIKQVHYHSKAKDKNKCSEKQKTSESNKLTTQSSKGDLLTITVKCFRYKKTTNNIQIILTLSNLCQLPRGKNSKLLLTPGASGDLQPPVTLLGRGRA